MSESPWRLSHRADRAALPLADAHYNRQKIGSPQFVPPGTCLVMLTEDRTALWVTSWPKAEYVKHAWRGAWVNSLFRNEGNHLSSNLIRHGVAHTRAVWPNVPELGIVTFVDPSKTKDKEVPGWCYRRAGWTDVGRTAGGLWVFQQLPDRKIGRRSEPMPEAEFIPGSQASLFDLEAS